MYTVMIEEAVDAIKQGQPKAEGYDENKIKLILSLEANLPDSYITSMNQRLDAYKSISSCQTEDELWDIRSALEDRYGRLPTAAVSLFHSIRIKIQASKLLISQINQKREVLEITFSEAFQPDPVKISGFLSQSDYQPRLLPENRIRVILPKASAEEIIRFLLTFKKEVF